MITLACAGKSRAQVPVRKNVARAFLVLSVDSIERTPAALAPASKVSATTLELVGMRVQSVPSSEAAGGVGAAGTQPRANGDQLPLLYRVVHTALSMPRTATSMPPAGVGAAAGPSISTPPSARQPLKAPMLPTLARSALSVPRMNTHVTPLPGIHAAAGAL